MNPQAKTSYADDSKHARLQKLVLGGLAVVSCQYEDNFGPAPPQLLIPGAVPLGPVPRRPALRPQARRQQVEQPESLPAPRLRSRPPSGRSGRLPVAPAPAPQFYAPPPPPPAIQQRPLIQQEDSIAPRPVNEESEDDYEEDLPSPGPFSPTPSPPTSPPTPPPPAPSFRPERPAFRPERPALLPTPAPELNFVSPTRPQLRPVTFSDEEEPQRRPSIQQYNRVDQSYTSRNKVRPTPAPEEPQSFSRQSQPQYTRVQAVVRAPQKPVYSNSKQEEHEKPIRQHQRPKKPVAQVLSRYREDNPDGSITWGFENDDGSFKEETIGTDCITYGKYGYIDPDGTRREYSYSTGIACDKNKEKQDQPGDGYVDYAENKYVLPNGDSIDLDKMVKNRARKPVEPQYRN